MKLHEYIDDDKFANVVFCRRNTDVGSIFLNSTPQVGGWEEKETILGSFFLVTSEIITGQEERERANGKR